MVTNNAGKNKFHYYPVKCRTLNVGNESTHLYHALMTIRNVGSVYGPNCLALLTMNNVGMALMETKASKKVALNLNYMIELLLITKHLNEIILNCKTLDGKISDDILDKVINIYFCY